MSLAVAARPQPSHAPSAHPPLRLGARAPVVARMQQLLVRAGFRPGPVDGYSFADFERAWGVKNKWFLAAR